jgi:hypothetical protein
MKTLKLITLLITLLAFGDARAQTKTEDPTAAENDAKVKAQTIIEKSRQNSGKKIALGEIKALTLSLETKLPAIDNFEEVITKTEINVSFPDKIRTFSIGSTSQNSSLATNILNGELFTKNVEFNSKNQTAGINVDLGSKESQKRELKWKSWSFVFPITLDAWYFPLEFKYRGIAESKDGRADLLEAVSSGGTTYRLFFDQNSHLLLLMSVSFQNKANKLIESKYFFSDYKENGGLIIAHKISFEQNGALMEERTIKNLKLNPVFKADFFDVKEK